MVSVLQVVGIIGAIYVLIVFILSIENFSNVKGQFLKKSALFFVFSLSTMILVSLIHYSQDVYIALVTSEFLLMLTLFYNYLKSNVYFLAAMVFTPYFEDIMVILSIYFSLYITGSILQAKSQESGGSTFVVSSFILMDIALVLQAFYILKFNASLMQLGVGLFVISIVLFLLPFLIGGLDKNA